MRFSQGKDAHIWLEGSDFIKHHVSTLQWERNDPIKKFFNVEHLMAEATQNMTLVKENIRFCEEPYIPARIELPDSMTP